MNYESALEYIHAVQWAGHKPGLTRTRTLLAALGDPHISSYELQGWPFVAGAAGAFCSLA